MEVILLKDVEKIGLRGEVVNVARGYMRNYLGPRRLAEPATPARVAELRKIEEQRARHEARSVEQAEEIAETLKKTVLRFEVNAGPRGRLFGSVTPTDITDELWRARKIRVDRRKIDLPETIKRVGRYEVPIEIFQGVTVPVKTLVVPEGGELPSEDELEAWEAEERAEAEAAAAAQAAEEAEPEPEWLEDEVEEEADAAAEGEAAETGAAEVTAEGEPEAEAADETAEPAELAGPADDERA